MCILGGDRFQRHSTTNSARTRGSRNVWHSSLLFFQADSVQHHKKSEKFIKNLKLKKNVWYFSIFSGISRNFLNTLKLLQTFKNVFETNLLKFSCIFFKFLKMYCVFICLISRRFFIILNDFQYFNELIYKLALIFSPFLHFTLKGCERR